MTEVAKMNNKYLSWIFFSLIILCALSLYSIGKRIQTNFVSQISRQEEPRLVEVHSTQELIRILNTYDLWNLEYKEKLPSKIIKNFPLDFKTIGNEEQKRAIFIHTILPSALMALTEIEKEKNQLKQILSKFSENQRLTISNVEKNLSSKEAKFIIHLTKKYRTSDLQELLKRVNVVPLSLLLAQAALESNWGTSRFALEGNNLFGIWTYKREGIIPLNRPPNTYHKVARYSSILQAVRDYLYNFNVGWAYDKFRTARLYTTDAEELVQYLPRYSQLGLIYTSRLKSIINTYNLKAYEARFKPYLAQLNLYN